MTKEEFLLNIKTRKLEAQGLFTLPDDLKESIGCDHGVARVKWVLHGWFARYAYAGAICEHDGCDNELFIMIGRDYKDYSTL